MKVTAKIRFNYGKKTYYPNDEIDMSDKDAKLLVAAGRVARVEDAGASAAGTDPEASQKRAGDAGAPGTAKRRADAPEAAGDARKSLAERSGAPADDDDAKSGRKSRGGGYKRRDMRSTDDKDAGETGDE